MTTNHTPTPRDHLSAEAATALALIDCGVVPDAAWILANKAQAFDALAARVADLEAALQFMVEECDSLEGTIGTFGPEWLQVARDQARAALAKGQA